MNSNPTGNSNVKQAVPFFMVTNMERSLYFYTKGLGFTIKNKWEPKDKTEWCWLQLGNASLMLQEYRQPEVTDKLGGGISIYFICEDALSIYKQIISNDISVSEPFVGNNMWVVGLSDPDGYKIFFESPTEVSEETKFSDWVKTTAAN